MSDVLSAIDRNGIDCRLLKVELTESQILKDIESVIGTLQQLRTHGIMIALDDFGTGYSSLSYLNRLPISQLKIDQSFVRDIQTNSNHAAIAKMIVTLANAFDLTVIAEGVETQQERDLLTGLGCNAFQGYWFGHPVPVEQFEQSMQVPPTDS